MMQVSSKVCIARVFRDEGIVGTRGGRLRNFNPSVCHTKLRMLYNSHSERI